MTAALRQLATRRDLIDRPTSEHDPRCHPERLGLRGLPEDWKWLGAFEAVPHLRSRRLLRFISASARTSALPPGRTSDHSIPRAGRRLALVLHRSNPDV